MHWACTLTRLAFSIFYFHFQISSAFAPRQNRPDVPGLTFPEIPPPPLPGDCCATMTVLRNPPQFRLPAAMFHIPSPCYLAKTWFRFAGGATTFVAVSLPFRSGTLRLRARLFRLRVSVPLLRVCAPFYLLLHLPSRHCRQYRTVRGSLSVTGRASRFPNRPTTTSKSFKVRHSTSCMYVSLPARSLSPGIALNTKKWSPPFICQQYARGKCSCSYRWRRKFLHSRSGKRNSIFEIVIFQHCP